MDRVKAVAGISLLIISIILYVYIAYTIPSRVLDDKAPWMHKHVIEFYREASTSRDHVLWYVVGKDLYRSPILLDIVVAAATSLSNLGLVSITLSIILSILVYITTYTTFKEHVAAGIASLLTVTTPVVMYWFRINMYGSYVMLVIGYLTVLVYSIALKRRSMPLTILTAILVSILWITWSSGWFLLLIVTSYTLVLIYSGIYNRYVLLSNILFLLTTIPLNIIGLSRYVTVYHIISYYLLGLSTIALVVLNKVLSREKAIASNIWKLVGSTAPAVMAIALTLITVYYIKPPGFMEIYVKTYRPLPDYMSIAILAPFALVLFMRAGYLSNIVEKPLEYFLVSGFIAGILFASIDPSLAVYAVASIAPMIAYGLERLYWATVGTLSGKIKYLVIAAVIWIIAASLIANAYSSYTVALSKPAVYYGPVPRGLVEGVLENSTLLSILDYVGENSIVVTYWGRSYWIVGYRDDLYTLADDNGPLEGYKLVSRILLSDEYTALGIINNTIVKDRNTTVYILLSEIVSVEKHPVLGTKNAHIGRPVVFRRPGEESEVRFIPLDDAARIINYIDLAGYDTRRYIDKSKATYSFETPLAWNDNMRRTVFFSLLITAINKLGYSAINDVYSKLEIDLADIEKPRHIVFVNASMTYMYTVSTERMDYKVYWMVALYRVELGG